MGRPRDVAVGCRVCGAAVAAREQGCPRCGSRRPFVCGVCGRTVEAPLNPPQLLADGTVACIRHAPWARCFACGRVGTYTEVTTTAWIYLGDRGIADALRRYPGVAAGALRLRATPTWICPTCDGVYRQAHRSATGSIGRLAAAAAVVWWVLREALATTRGRDDARSHHGWREER